VESADAATFSAAMQEGVSAAYKAVMKPAEGTVLTVSRLAAKQAVDTAAAGETDLERVLEDAIRVGYAALAQTTEMNPVLKKAGVVDAGGKGYLLILDGMLAELRGEPMPETEAGESREEKADFATMAAEDITFAFDTVFIVRKAMADISLEPLRTYLNSIGDSLVIGEDDEAFKVHVHTNIPGNALNEAQKYGTLELAKIENMRTQADDLAAGKHVQSTDDLDAVEAELESVPAEETPAVAAVVCCTLVGTVACAKLVGASLPILAEKIGFDPAVMASPFISTIVDALSLLIYFRFATWILGV
jgi:dihydroxyacetone kinase-like predicted kinase